MEQGSEQGKQAIDQLVGLGNMRVWSLIITIFGDAVVGRGGVVAASTLAALTEHMGIKPEAFRVALSRLTKDGWIVRSKKGRLSFYQLSAQGNAEFGPATARIYAKSAGTSDGWKLVLMPTAVTEALPVGAVGLGGRAFLAPGGIAANEGMCVSGSFDAVPAWVQDRIGKPEIAQGYDRLHHVLAAISGEQFTDLEAAAVRVLAVHQWRRLILRHADLPISFFPKEWKGEACRLLFLNLLDLLNTQSNNWFDSQIK